MSLMTAEEEDRGASVGSKDSDQRTRSSIVQQQWDGNAGGGPSSIVDEASQQGLLIVIQHNAKACIILLH